MPTGTTSYLLLSIALRTEAAESRETSCSPLRPPNRTPTRSFFMLSILLRGGQAESDHRESSIRGLFSQIGLNGRQDFPGAQGTKYGYETLPRLCLRPRQRRYHLVEYATDLASCPG